MQEEEQILLQEVHIVSLEKILSLSHRKNYSFEKFLPVTGKLHQGKQIAQSQFQMAKRILHKKLQKKNLRKIVKNNCMEQIAPCKLHKAN